MFIVIFSFVVTTTTCLQRETFVLLVNLLGGGAQRGSSLFPGAPAVQGGWQEGPTLGSDVGAGRGSCSAQGPLLGDSPHKWWGPEKVPARQEGGSPLTTQL